MTEKLRRSKSVVTRLEEPWSTSTGGQRELVVAEVNRGISRMAMPRRWSAAELRRKKLIFPSMPQRRVLNAFRHLRTQLMQLNRSENMTVSVASAGEGEESAALNAVNLAAAFALDPHKTALLVDCNPYCPIAHKYMLERSRLGLTDYLERSELPLEKIIYPTGVERLRVIPVGSVSGSAAEQVHSRRMRDLVAELKDRYKDRFIIINAPSMTASSEAPVLSQYCDMTLLVAPYGKITASDIEGASQVVDKERLAGIVYSYL